jgi:hypothetical protein
MKSFTYVLQETGEYLVARTNACTDAGAAICNVGFALSNSFFSVGIEQKTQPDVAMSMRSATGKE